MERPFPKKKPYPFAVGLKALRWEKMHSGGMISTRMKWEEMYWSGMK